MLMDKIEIFKALSNETRLHIVEWLKEPDVTGISQSTVSHYLDILQRAGLLIAERHGKWTYYRRNEDVLSELAGYFDHEI